MVRIAATEGRKLVWIAQIDRIMLNADNDRLRKAKIICDLHGAIGDCPSFTPLEIA